MKSKQFVSLWAMLFGLLLSCSEATAFYNPETGRWLNRDPINELGAKSFERKRESFSRDEEKHLYAFVLNSPISRQDRLGLNCVCGPDITGALRATLDEVEQEFSSLGPLEKIGACAEVAGFGVNYSDAWDINTLAYTSPNYQTGNPAYNDPLEKGESNHCCSYYSCRDTVVIDGKCVHSHQATYVLLGKIAGLCGVAVEVVHPFIDQWKKQRYPNSDPIYTEQAHALTDWGNRGSWPDGFEDLGACFIKPDNQTKLPNFKWTWEPFHPRTHE